MRGATYPDYSFAPSYSAIAAQQVGAVAQQAEEMKMRRYKHLDSCPFFTPVVTETTGVFGPRTVERVAVQRGNAASFLGKMKVDSEYEEFFL